MSWDTVIGLVSGAVISFITILAIRALEQAKRGKRK